jgi:hypothetical protein
MNTLAMQPRTNGIRLEAQTTPLGRMGAWYYSHRRVVLLAWVAVLAVFSFLGKASGPRFKDSINGANATVGPSGPGPRVRATRSRWGRTDPCTPGQCGPAGLANPVCCRYSLSEQPAKGCTRPARAGPRRSGRPTLPER